MENSKETNGDKEKKRILIVEDDSFLLDLLAKKISDSGLDLKVATNTEKALSVLSDSKIDLICLDILLPGQSGTDFLKILKADSKYKDIPVLIVSNLNPKEKEEAQYGSVDYLIKAEVSPAEIIVRVKHILGVS